MLVERTNIFQVMLRLESKTALALDTETTGLRPYHGDRPFCFIIADDSAEFVFDLGHWDKFWQPSRERLAQFFSTPRLWYLANAKFDMAMLDQHLGLTLMGKVHDLMVHERILDSTIQHGFSLSSIAARYGMQKSSAVDRYIKDHKLVTKSDVPGKKRQETKPHFDQVPMDILVPYAEQDARVTYDIGVEQRRRLAESREDGVPDLTCLADNETWLLRTVYQMEKTGVLVDLPYCQRAIDYEDSRRRRATLEFESLAGVKFKNSAKVFAPLFKGEELQKTATGQPCFDAEALASYTSPFAKIIATIRDAKSKSDYYQGFIYHADKNGVIHTSFNQHQARTGRFSSSAPNCQNLTKPDEHTVEEFTPRRALIPRPGHFFAMFDYDQVEYRLMLEYAKSMPLIDKINCGLDVHAATAELAGITRAQAKTTNFLTIYGGGDAVLAKRLGKTVAEAKEIRAAVFNAAPEIRWFINTVLRRVEDRGFAHNWLGRRFHFADADESYRAPNHVIQGGCADVLKMAMNEVHTYLCAGTSGARLVLTIHDELVLECPEGKSGTISEVKQVMERVYPSKYLPLTCSVEHSFKSLADKVEGLPP